MDYGLDRFEVRCEYSDDDDIGFLGTFDTLTDAEMYALDIRENYAKPDLEIGRTWTVTRVWVVDLQK